MVDTVYQFDNDVRALLSTIKDVALSESTKEASESSKAYIVYFGNDIVAGSSWEYGSLVGPQDDAIIHQFSVLISAPSTVARNAIVSEVRRRLVGTVLDNASAINETGMMNSFGDSDATLKPVKYTYFITFSAIIDRSGNA